MSEKNLNGIKVLDFTRVLAGPYLTQMLRDLGAEVIKIEQPGIGADERHMPPLVDAQSGGYQSGYFMMLNRGKKSIALNLKTAAGKEIVYDLVRRADIVAENFKPGVMKSLGFDYEELKKIKPDLIMCSISTFGQEGPDSKRVGYDIVAQATSGLMWLTGDPDRPPMRSGTSIGDVNAASHALAATLAALYYREKTGRGQHIDISMRDCLSAILEAAIPRYTLSKGADNPGRTGPHHPTMGPYGVFDCGRDRYVVIGALNEPIWQRLCQVIGHPEMATDPKFVGTAQRGSNPESKRIMIETIETWLKEVDDPHKAARLFTEANVPAAPVLSIGELLDDPQFLSRDMLVTVEDPMLGQSVLPATPMRFSETTVDNPAPPPLLGEHTNSVLTGLGYTDEKIAALRAEGVFDPKK